MTKLCPRGKAAAKRKFKVYPSAYANAYASKVCAGKAKDDRGVRRKDFKGPKPSGGGGTGSAARKIRKANKGAMMKKPIKAGLGMLALGAGLALAGRNALKKKKSGTVAPVKGAIDPVTGEQQQTDTANTNEKMLAAIKNAKVLGSKKGGMQVQKAGLGLMMAMGKKNRRKVRKKMKDENLQFISPGLYAMSSLSIGGMPESTGSHIQQEIDGESFTNPSAQAYYKDLLG